MRQRFSITTHPRYPLLICSDGYMVTVLQVWLPVSSWSVCIVKMTMYHKITFFSFSGVFIGSNIFVQKKRIERGKKCDVCLLLGYEDCLIYHISSVVCMLNMNQNVLFHNILIFFIVTKNSQLNYSAIQSDCQPLLFCMCCLGFFSIAL